jgi:hypothetical protein
LALLLTGLDVAVICAVSLPQLGKEKVVPIGQSFILHQKKPSL